MDKKVVVIGAGPCGLGACLRLQQLKHQNWMLIDKNDYTGGLAGSFVDDKNFLWDAGGHVIFSHYKYFNDVVDQGVLTYAKNIGDRHQIAEIDKNSLENLWITHKRESWIRFKPESWIAYPFQNNFLHLNDPAVAQDCINGLLELENSAKKFSKSKNFQDLIDNRFGFGLAKHFMNPYNLKVWGYPANQMNSQWVSERVAMVDLSKILNDHINYLSNSNNNNNNNNNSKSINNWGPNATFKYPKYGGTGSIWKGVGHLLNEKNLKLKTEIVEIDTDQKIVKFSNSNTTNYDYIINTIPIDDLIKKYIKPTKTLNVEKLFTKYGEPKYSTTNIIGLGFNGQIPLDLKDKSWMYFPSSRSPFYRMTAFSNYSPYLVSKPYEQWSLMFEVCETEYLPRTSDVIEKTISGALNENLINELDLENLVSKFHSRFEYGYPTPYLNRDSFLDELEPILRNNLNIYGRGRFGGWRYEVSNQDHSLMQGVEAVDNILFGCEEQTYFFPDHVNNRKETTRRFFIS